LLQRAGDLEREQWVAVRGLVDASEHGPRKDQFDTVPKHPPDRPDAHRLDLDPLHPSNVEGPEQIQCRRLGDPVRGEHGDGLVAESPERELERPRRGAVEPVQVVDGEQHRPERPDGSQRTEHRDGNGASIRRGPVVLAEQQRDLQRAALRSGKRREDALELLPQQIAECGEGERGLGLYGASLEQSEPGTLRHRDPAPPQGGLADPRLTLEHQGARERVRRLEELTHGRELLFPADRIRVDEGLLDAAVCSEATPLANLSPTRW
jgi:hypothetical protein